MKNKIDQSRHLAYICRDVAIILRQVKEQQQTMNQQQQNHRLRTDSNQSQQEI